MNHTIGVVGLGNMGSIIAKLLAEKYTVIGFDIDSNKRNLLSESGIDSAKTLQELARNSDFIILSLPNGTISKESVKQMKEELTEKHTIIETSTVLPYDIEKLFELCKEKNVHIVDAAILGGVNQLQEADVEFLVGGIADDIYNVRSILEVLGNRIKHMGGIGAGMSAKVISNAVSHTVMVLIIEAATVGKKLGIDHDQMHELLSGKTTYERPLDHRFNERIANSNFVGGMSTTNARKDSTLIMELAQKLNVPLFTIQSSHTVYELANNEGFGEYDYASIASLWEKWCGTQLSKEEENENAQI